LLVGLEWCQAEFVSEIAAFGEYLFRSIALSTGIQSLREIMQDAGDAILHLGAGNMRDAPTTHGGKSFRPCGD
jgi:hypothetical protein